MNGKIELKIEQENGVTVIIIHTPRVMVDMGESLENEVVHEMLKSANPKILLDFSDVQFISSAILGKLIKLNARVAVERNGQFKICKLSDRIAEVFRITGLEKLFQIYKTKAEALADFK